MKPVEVVVVDSKKVSCSGGVTQKSADTSTHPLVYLNMGEKDFVVCPYCEKYFTTKKPSGDFQVSKQNQYS
ncbi:MAG: Zinc-finger domain [Rickettsiaceae bacterium]|jgi:uncharacterized Zn-finger protein|nr:Zinc-finger domain [Rickettsiaceae bacterium]